MATPAQALASISSAVATLTSATQGVSDYTDVYEQVSSGGKIYQVRGLPIRWEPDSTVTYTAMRVEISVIQSVPHETGGTEEQDYTRGNLQTYALSLVKASWWRDISGIRDVLAGPDAEVEREGNLIQATFSVEVSLDP